MPHTLQQLADRIGARLIGYGNIEVRKVASIHQAKDGDLVFAQTEKQLSEAMASAATAVIAGEFASGQDARKPLLVAKNPRLAFALAGAMLHPPKAAAAGIHASAVVHPSAKIAASATVEACAVIEADAVIGERTRIGSGCWIGEGVRIGDDCDLHPRVVVYSGTELGRHVVVKAGAVLGSEGFGFVRDETRGTYHKFPQIGRLIIGDNVEIGANTTIDRGALESTMIGSGTKLDNLVHIGHNCEIGSNVVMAAFTGIAGSARIGDGVITAGQAGVSDHVDVPAGVIVGAQCGVTSSLHAPGVYMGVPARPLRQYLRELVVMARLANKSK